MYDAASPRARVTGLGLLTEPELAGPAPKIPGVPLRSET